MYPNQITKQMIDLQKTAFDNSFKMITTLNEHGENFTNIVINQSPWFPEEGKKAVSGWMNAYKKGVNDFKTTVDNNFQKVETYFGDKSDSDAASSKDAKKTAKTS